MKVVTLPYLVGGDPFAHAGKIDIRTDVFRQFRHVGLTESLQRFIDSINEDYFLQNKISPLLGFLCPILCKG